MALGGRASSTAAGTVNVPAPARVVQLKPAPGPAALSEVPLTIT